MAQLSSRYSTALFDLAQESGQTDEIFTYVESVLDVFKTEDSLFDALLHPRITFTEKTSIIKNVFKDAPDILAGLLFLLLKKDRANEIPNVLKDFINKVYTYKGITTAEVVSAGPLTEQQLSDISDKLSKNLNKQVELTHSIDPSLLGGFRIRVDGHVIDSSISRQINDIKKQLLNIGT